MKKHWIILYAIYLLLLPFSAPEASPRQEVLTGPIQAQVLKVLDGDTVDVKAHIWIGQEIEISIRLNGIDTPEIKGKCQEERSMAEAAQQEIIRLINGKPIRIYNIRLEKYAGRALAEAETANGINIASHMIQKGLARPYHGEKRGVWCGG